MKPSSLVLVFLAVLLCAFISGCRKEKTEPYGPDLALARPPLALTEARSQDIDSFQMLGQRLLAAHCSKEKGAFSADLLGPQVLLTLLLNASENESLEQLATQMKVPEGRHDLFTKSLQSRLDALRSLPEKPVSQGTAVWMIWPILLTPDFQNEMGERLGASVYRLGNAGITASNRIEAWQLKSGAKAAIPAPLDKSEVMTATLCLNLDPGEWSLAGTSDVKGGTVLFFESTKGLAMAVASGPEMAGLLTSQNLVNAHASMENLSGSAKISPSASSSADVGRGLKEAGFDFVLEGSNDWRYMSMELRQASLTSIHSQLDLNSSLPEVASSSDTVFLIFEPNSQLVIAGGRLERTPAKE